MGKTGKKPIIGLLGGIASGKSTVAAEFAKLGCKVIDADKIAHGLLEEPSVLQRVTGLFGNAILDWAGRIDRRKLAAAAFGDAEKLSSLNNIIHPRVLARVEELIEQYSRSSRIKAIVLDMPLLAEVGWAKRCDRVIYVECNVKRRIERAKKSLHLDETELKIRENFQISLDSKSRLADNVVNNNSDFSALVRQIADIFTCIIDN